jgi:hypothetical protein
LSRYRVSKLSVPSSRTPKGDAAAASDASIKALRAQKSAATGRSATPELTASNRRLAASTFGRPFAASSSVKRHCRWRFVASTTSRSMKVSVPTPARTSRSAI